MVPQISSPKASTLFQEQESQQQFDKLEKERSKLTHQTSCIESQKNKARAKMKELSGSFLGRLVEPQHSSLINWILSWLPGYSEKKREMEKLKAEIKTFDSKLLSNNQKLNDCQEKIEEFLKDHPILSATSQREEKKEGVAFALLQEACGGEEAFNKLPELKLDETNERMFYHLDIEAQDMEAPIMRLQDRQGVVVNTNKGVITVFQAPGNIWQIKGLSSAGLGEFANGDGKVNQDAYRVLEPLITQGSVTLKVHGKEKKIELMPNINN